MAHAAWVGGEGARFGMCSLDRGDVFSFGGNVFSFWANVFSFWANVFSFRPDVFTSEGQVFSEEGKRAEGRRVRPEKRGAARVAWEVQGCGSTRARSAGSGQALRKTPARLTTNGWGRTRGHPQGEPLRGENGRG